VVEHVAHATTNGARTADDERAMRDTRNERRETRDIEESMTNLL
jgi:hypothetical protein